jgi:hypothetical protein
MLSRFDPRDSEIVLAHAIDVDDGAFFIPGPGRFACGAMADTARWSTAAYVAERFVGSGWLTVPPPLDYVTSEFSSESGTAMHHYARHDDPARAICIVIPRQMASHPAADSFARHAAEIIAIEHDTPPAGYWFLTPDDCLVSDLGDFRIRLGQ